MLDESRKGGLSLVLCHQRFGQLGRDEELSDALASEAQIKIVFGGLRYESAASLAEDMLLPTINQRQIVETYQRLVTRHRLEHMMTISNTSSSASGRTISGSTTVTEHGGASETQGASQAYNSAFSQTIGEQSMLMPYYEYEKSHDAERSRDEKLSHAASTFTSLKKRECYVKLPTTPEARKFVVQMLRQNRLSETETREYERRRYVAQDAISPAGADSILAADREAFISRAQIRPKKKLPSSSTPPRI